MNGSCERRTHHGGAGQAWDWWTSTRFLLAPDDTFAKAKFRDHRFTTAAVLAILVVFLPSMWFWDYLIDPVGARNTVLLRLPGLALIPLAFLFWSGRAGRRTLAVATLVFALGAEALRVVILARVGNGMVLGMGGFMYCMLLGIVGGQCFSLSLGLAYSFLAALLPHLLAWSGAVQGFPHEQYAALMWPAMGVASLAQVVLAHQYLQRYHLEQQLEWPSDTDPLAGVTREGTEPSGDSRQFEIWPDGITTGGHRKQGPSLQRARNPGSWSQRCREDFRTRKQFRALTRNDQLLGRFFFGGKDAQWGTYGAYLEIHFGPEQRRIFVVGCGFHGAESLPHQTFEPLTSVPLELEGSGTHFLECSCDLGFGWLFRATLEQQVELETNTWRLRQMRAEIRNTHYRPLPHAPLRAPAWRWESAAVLPVITNPGGGPDDVLCPNCVGLGYRVAINLQQGSGGGPAQPRKGRVACVVCGGVGEEHEPWHLAEHPERKGPPTFVKGTGTIRMERLAPLQSLRYEGAPKVPWPRPDPSA